MALEIDIRRKKPIEEWKAKKFVVQDPEKDYVPNKMMDKTFYHFAQEDSFDALFGELDLVPSEKQFSTIYTEVGPSGNTLLHVAASSGSKGVTELLALHFPLLMTRKNFQGDTAVHLAARAGKLDIIIQILVRFARYQAEAGTSDNADHLPKMKNKRGNTPLHDAVIYGRADVARYLAWESPQVCHHKNKAEKSPLYLAVERRVIEKVETRIDENENDMLEILLEATATTDGHLLERLEGKSPAHAAVKREKLAVLEKIADKRPDLMHVKDREGGNPLHFASSRDYLEGVKFLLQKFSGCAIESNQEGHYPIHVACKMGHVRVVEEMVKQWPNPKDFLNDKGQNILHVAAESGQDAVVKYVLGNPGLEALINEKDSDGNTPMHLAAMKGHPKAVFALVMDDHVDCNIANSEKLTAYFAALNAYEGGSMDFENTNSNAKDKEIVHCGKTPITIPTTDFHKKDKQYYSRHTNGGKQRSTAVTTGKIPYIGIGLATLILLFYTNVEGRALAKKMRMRRGQSKSLTKEELKTRIEALLVVAVLVAGATYAGALQMPAGGSSNSNNVDKINRNSTSSTTPNDTSINKTQKHSQNYVTYGAIAFHLSLVSAMILCWALFCGVESGSFAVALASGFIGYSIFFMGCAFTFAVGIAVVKYPETSWVYTLSYNFFLPLQVFLGFPFLILSVLEVVYPFRFIFTLLSFWLLFCKSYIKILGGKMKKVRSGHH